MIRDFTLIITLIIVRVLHDIKWVFGDIIVTLKLVLVIRGLVLIVKAQDLIVREIILVLGNVFVILRAKDLIVKKVILILGYFWYVDAIILFKAFIDKFL
jgi:hypothetical protein